jgi:hypothetical protein
VTRRDGALRRCDDPFAMRCERMRGAELQRVPVCAFNNKSRHRVLVFDLRFDT